MSNNDCPKCGNRWEPDCDQFGCWVCGYNKSDDVVRMCYKYLHKFVDIYEDGNHKNEIPENIKVTIFCKSENKEGFLINILYDELGLEELIAKKWIIHSELENLVGCSFTDT